MATNFFAEIQIPSDYQQAKKVEDDILHAAMHFDYPDQDIFAIRLCLEEALTNAIRHGNGMDDNKKVDIRYYVDSKRVEIDIIDQGNGFKLEDVPDPREMDNIDQPNGRGILLMKSYLNVIEYNKKGNGIHMVKYKDKAVE
ncbi:MAG: ATP-binding protein [Phycisphaerae bacterium]|nr:ATP-binding protein [Phycisphaerae bacterium]